MKDIISLIVKSLGIFLILISIFALVIGVDYIKEINHLGTTGIRISEISSGHYIIRSISNQQQKYLNEISPGDTVIKINGIHYTDKENFKTNLYSHKLGQKIPFTILRSGSETTFLVNVNPLSTIEKIILILFNTIPALLMMLYVIVGTWGIFKSSKSKEIILITLFCYSFGCFMYGTINIGRASESTLSRMLYFNNLKGFVQLIMIFAPALWLLLFSIYPAENKFFQKHKIISLTFIFIVPLLIIITNIFSVQIAILNIFIIIIIFAQMSLGVKLLASNSGKTSSLLEQRKTKLMLLGIKYGITSIFLGWLVVIITQTVTDDISSDYTLLALIFFIITETFGLIIPFTFLNSFFGNKLIETESALKRRLRYMAFSFVTLSFYLFLIFIIMKLIVNFFTLTDPSVIILCVLFLSLTFTPLNKKIIETVEEKFYPEKTKYAESFKNYIKEISSRTNISEVISELEQWICSTIAINPVFAFTIMENDNKSLFLPGDKKSLLEKLSKSGNIYWDERADLPDISDNDLQWINEHKFSVTIPMVAQGELIGALNLGRKKNGDDYSSEEIEIITQAAEQSALTISNLRLQSEYLEKKRIERELQLARKMQERLMPAEIPFINGLDISAKSIPCYEVAGDYYDIIDLGNEKACFIIADVCGKGAGAAIIMANLQASIRVGINLNENIEFTKFIETINKHVYDNTSASEFITMFMAIWDNNSNTLHYINAGHNPPLLINKDTSYTKLEAGGIVLGILPQAKYEKSKINMEKGSVLVVYTDGLEESMNEKGEPFSTENIINTVKNNIELEAKEILDKLIESLKNHCNTRPPHDDITLIVIKS